ncbi:MAG: riboflavin synthase [Candidatus Saganbacteria bacterium]|nr:riboflavin synthase [Candidatus Saganbacteria bacterium]
MFTGIIEEIGSIKNTKAAAGLKSFEVGAKTVLSDLKKGDSIAVNGVCLTVVNKKRRSFIVEAVSPTLSDTTLDLLKTGDEVNLERALKASDRLSGHIVSGHVDGTATVKEVIRTSGSVKMVFSSGRNILSGIIKKGSVSINGISLTVAEIFRDSFSVVIIPFTMKNTTLAKLRIGDKVNIETDLVGKYASKAMKKKPDDEVESGVSLGLMLKDMIGRTGSQYECN